MILATAAVILYLLGLNQARDYYHMYNYEVQRLNLDADRAHWGHILAWPIMEVIDLFKGGTKEKV